MLKEEDFIQKETSKDTQRTKKVLLIKQNLKENIKIAQNDITGQFYKTFLLYISHCQKWLRQVV